MAKALVSSGMNKCIGCFTCQRVCAAVNHKSFTDNKSAIKVRSLGGLSGKFFATHCLACKDERACMEACPTGALAKRRGGGVILNRDLCIGCKKCEDACPVRAIHFTADEKYPIICKHCGACTRYCPHECLEMEERSDVE